jgi:hypothetical protein
MFPPKGQNFIHKYNGSSDSIYCARSIYTMRQVWAGSDGYRCQDVDALGQSLLTLAFRGPSIFYFCIHAVVRNVHAALDRTGYEMKGFEHEN